MSHSHAPRTARPCVGVPMLKLAVRFGVSGGAWSRSASEHVCRFPSPATGPRSTPDNEWRGYRYRGCHRHPQRTSSSNHLSLEVPSGSSHRLDAARLWIWGPPFEPGRRHKIMNCSPSGPAGQYDVIARERGSGSSSPEEGRRQTGRDRPRPMPHAFDLSS